MRGLLALLMLLWPVTVVAATPQPFQRGSWSNLLDAHRGRATIVHFWGLTCGPCVVELPEWGRFAGRRGDTDLVMVDADPTTIAPEDLATVLEKAGLGRVESWRFADNFTERLEYEIDPEWHGELPYTVLLGRDGSAKTIVGAVDFAQLAKWLDGQLVRSLDAPRWAAAQMAPPLSRLFDGGTR